MSGRDPNIENVLVVAAALGDLVEQAVFLGGSVVGLLLTDEAASPPRVTKDVDIAVDVAPMAAWQARLVPKLQQRGFKETGDVICRWSVDGVLVDIMPTRGDVLGFSNRWYPTAVSTAQEVSVRDVRVRVIAPGSFIATKIEAFNDRGGSDFYESHDVEDVLVVVDGRPTIASDVAAAPPDVRSFVAAEVAGWLADSRFCNALEGHVERGRDPIVRSRLREMAALAK